MTQNASPPLRAFIEARFGAAPDIPTHLPQADLLASMLARGSCRAYLDTPVPDETLDVLCAAALASPTKSDLQQRDIIVLKSAGLRASIAGLVSGQAWVADAPMMVVFCGNNRRQRLIHDWHGIPFANDHLDALFNATADVAIALGAFVTAAEAIGLGCCPISAVRNEAAAVSQLLGLPAHVFPFAGLAIGYPRDAGQIAKRLPLPVTCHVDRYQEDDLRGTVAAYDADRAASQPYAGQRLVDIFGTAQTYGWSEDKVRQYSQKERADFGRYIRAQGFCLD